jgi:hypothetical protein
VLGNIAAGLMTLTAAVRTTSPDKIVEYRQIIGTPIVARKRRPGLRSYPSRLAPPIASVTSEATATLSIVAMRWETLGMSVVEMLQWKSLIRLNNNLTVRRSRC